MQAKFRKSFLTVAALFSLAAAALTAFAPQADAKPMGSCASRHSYCTERCAMNTNGEAGPCISRTCDHQYKACMSEGSFGGQRPGERGAGGGSSGGKGGGKPGPIVRDHRGK
jgi:hypothetical protein